MLVCQSKAELDLDRGAFAHLALPGAKFALRVPLLISGPQTLAKRAVMPVWQLPGGELGAFNASATLRGVSTLGVLPPWAPLILGQMGRRWFWMAMGCLVCQCRP